MVNAFTRENISESHPIPAKSARSSLTPIAGLVLLPWHVALLPALFCTRRGSFWVLYMQKDEAFPLKRVERAAFPSQSIALWFPFLQLIFY